MQHLLKKIFSGSFVILSKAPWSWNRRIKSSGVQHHVTGQAVTLPSWTAWSWEKRHYDLSWLSLMWEQSSVDNHHFEGIFCLHFLPKNAGKWFLQNAGSTYLPNHTHGIGFKETVTHTLATMTTSNSHTHHKNILYTIRGSLQNQLSVLNYVTTYPLSIHTFITKQMYTICMHFTSKCRHFTDGLLECLSDDQVLPAVYLSHPTVSHRHMHRSS